MPNRQKNNATVLSCSRQRMARGYGPSSGSGILRPVVPRCRCAHTRSRNGRRSLPMRSMPLWKSSMLRHGMDTCAFSDQMTDDPRHASERPYAHSLRAVLWNKIAVQIRPDAAVLHSVFGSRLSLSYKWLRCLRFSQRNTCKVFASRRLCLQPKRLWPAVSL